MHPFPAFRSAVVAHSAHEIHKSHVIHPMSPIHRTASIRLMSSIDHVPCIPSLLSVHYLSPIHHKRSMPLMSSITCHPFLHCHPFIKFSTRHQPITCHPATFSGIRSSHVLLHYMSLAHHKSTARNTPSSHQVSSIHICQPSITC